MEKEIFQKALWIEEPWYIKEIEFKEKEERLDIYLDFRKWSKFKNEEWEEVWAEQTENRIWKHLFFWQYPTYLHCRVPKVKTKDKKVKIIEVPWARKWSWFTLLFEWLALELMKHMPVSKVWEWLKEDDERLMRIAKHYVEKSKKKANYSKIKRWWIDETSRKKWHNYITTFINFETKKVSCIVEWKWKDTIKDIVEDIEKHGWKRNNIEEVSIDFSTSFTVWVLEYMPKANIIYDRFHLMQMIQKALDEVRRQESISNKLLKWSRYLWLKSDKDLKEKERIELKELKQENKVLAEAYQMKENLKEFFNKETKEQAELYLKLWCEWVENSGIEAMKKVVKTIKIHWFWIMNYITKRMNNWVVEWINSIIQTIKRRARWFRNVENFKTMIYLKIWDFEICQV